MCDDGNKWNTTTTWCVYPCKFKHSQGHKPAYLLQKKFKIETEIENWIQKYDEELGYKQEEYEKVDTVYQQEKKLLVELEERFAVVEVSTMIGYLCNCGRTTGAPSDIHRQLWVIQSEIHCSVYRSKT